MRSLSSMARILELNNATEDINWDNIVLVEIKTKGCYIGVIEGLHGVGFLVKKTLKANILSFLGISDRIGLLNMSYSKVSLSIIQVYAPTESSNKQEIEKFYMNLQKAPKQADLKNALNKQALLVIGYFNAKNGYSKHEEHMIMKRHEYGQQNARGERLIVFAYENKLSMMNS